MSALPTGESEPVNSHSTKRYVALERDPTMMEELRELWRYRNLLRVMVRRELKIRYKNSVLGFFWSLINPLVTVIVMTFVFKYIMGVKVPNYSAYILAGYLPFTFFQLALMDSAQSVLGSIQLVRKIYFPREILPLTYVIANFVHLVLAIAMFFVYLAVIYLRHPQEIPFRATVALLPLLLVINLFLAAGFSLLISALNVFYEDVKYIVGIITYLLLFLCPVMYFSEQVRYSGMFGGGGRIVYLIYHLNPIAEMVTAYRKVLLAPQAVVARTGGTYPPLPLDWRLLSFTAAFSVFILWYGYRTFNKLKWRFVERT